VALEFDGVLGAVNGKYSVNVQQPPPKSGIDARDARDARVGRTKVGTVFSFFFSFFLSFFLFSLILSERVRYSRGEFVFPTKIPLAEIRQ